jgi:hypothetical protein
LRLHPRRTIPVLLMALAALPAAAAELTLYAWSAPAPTVLSGEVIGQVGKYTEVQAGQVFRGEFEPGARLLVDLKHTNRLRNLDVDPRALKLLPGEQRILLLHESPIKTVEGLPVYRLVRGVRGTRELPREGADVMLLALGKFIQIQDRKNEAATWELLAGMLEESNPIVLETALEQHLKFRRGAPAHLGSIRPLLDHPGSGIREAASRLIGQIMERYSREGIPEEAELRSELVARARRDEVVLVRIAATGALAAFEGPGVLEILREIAAEDPEQEVRYMAETILLSRQPQDSAED